MLEHLQNYGVRKEQWTLLEAVRCQRIVQGITFNAGAEAGTASAASACDFQTLPGPGPVAGAAYLRQTHMVLTRRIDGPPALRSWRRLLSGLWVASATLALPAAADASFLS